MHGHARVVPDVSHRKESVLPDVAQAVIQKEKEGKGCKIISMSLYGNNSRYVQGAIENAVLAARDWPDWTLRIYFGQGVPLEAMKIAQMLGAETVHINAAHQSPRLCMYWRFFALEDPTATRVIIRDVDARLSRRDHAAVQEWVQSGRPFHTLHDHSSHLPVILGGMWGAVGGFLHPRVVQAWRDSKDQDAVVWSNDQGWLADVVWPLVKNHTLDHSSFYCQQYGAAEWRGFPTQRRDQQDFVGNIYIQANSWQGVKVPAECPATCRRKVEWTAC